jgi:hypothetical protein
MRTPRLILGTLVVVLAVVAIGMGVRLTVVGSSDVPCGNTISHVLRSPAGTRTAVVFSRSCGAMTSRAGTGVSILRGADSTLSTSDEGNVYLNDNWGPDHARVPTDIEVRWQSDSALVIRHRANAHVVVAAVKFAGVTISHDTIR